MDGCSPRPYAAAEGVSSMSLSAQGDLFPGSLDFKKESALIASSPGQVL